MSSYQSRIPYISGRNNTVPKRYPRKADGEPLGWGVPCVPSVGVYAGALGITKKGKFMF